MNPTGLRPPRISPGEWEDLTRRVPALGTRVLIDLVNGLDISADLIRVTTPATGPLRLLTEQMSRRQGKRQEALHSKFQESLQNAALWLDGLQTQQIHHSRYLARLANRLKEVEHGVRGLARAHRELADDVERLEARLEASIAQLEAQRQEFQVLVDAQNARDHIEGAMAAWDAGDYDDLPLLLQAAIVIEDLFLGAFGVHFQRKPELIDELRKRCVATMRGKALEQAGPGNPVLAARTDQLVVTEAWLGTLRAAEPAHRMAVACLYGHAEGMPWPLPLNRAMLRVALADEAPRGPQEWLQFKRPADLPYVLNFRRLSERLAEEANQRHVAAAEES